MVDATVVPAQVAGTTRGDSPRQLALKRLRRNWPAQIFGVVFLLIVVACLLAPVYAKHIAHTGPNENHISEVIKVGVTSDSSNYTMSSFRLALIPC